MLDAILAVLSATYSLPCWTPGAPGCAVNFSVMRSPIIRAVLPLGAAFLAFAVIAGTASELRIPMVKLRFWLARRICGRYALEYLPVPLFAVLGRAPWR